MPPDHIFAHMVLLKYQNPLPLNAHAEVHTAVRITYSNTLKHTATHCNLYTLQQCVEHAATPATKCLYNLRHDSFIATTYPFAT